MTIIPTKRDFVRYDNVRNSTTGTDDCGDDEVQHVPVWLVIRIVIVRIIIVRSIIIVSIIIVSVNIVSIVTWFTVWLACVIQLFGMPSNTESVRVIGRLGRGPLRTQNRILNSDSVLFPD